MNPSNILRGRDLLSLMELEQSEIKTILDMALELKNKQKKQIPHRLLDGKTLAMIFQKASTRTRVSFEVGMYQLGGHAMFLNHQELQMGRGEPIKDTARVLSRYVDGIMIRTHEHAQVEELAYYADVPIINGLTDTFHPCQALADLMTIIEHKKCLEGVQVTYYGDGNNVAHSLIIGATKMGMKVIACTPSEYAPHAEILRKARGYASHSGGSVEVISNPEEATRGSDILYTDVWTSMGQEQEKEHRKQILSPYQVNEALLKVAATGAMVMHCMPVHRGEEITEEIMDQHSQVILDQAENRLHAQKALMALLM